MVWLLAAPGDSQRARQRLVGSHPPGIAGPRQRHPRGGRRAFARCQRCGPEEFAADLRKIHGASLRLVAPLEELLAVAGNSAGLLDREARHQLRTPLNHILGYCELWIEDAEAQLLEGFVEDLRKIISLAKGLLARIDEAARVVKTASDTDIDLDAAGLPEMIKDVVDSVPVLSVDRPSFARTGNVLVVDDNQDNREVLRRWLMRDGHTVDEAADGLQALERARTATYDVILLDVIMPRGNGIETLEQLKS